MNKTNDTFKMFYNILMILQWYEGIRFRINSIVFIRRSSKYIIGSFVHTYSFQASMTNAILGKSTTHKIVFLNRHKKADTVDTILIFVEHFLAQYLA